MSEPKTAAFDLFKTFVDLTDGGGATPIAVTDRFWAELEAEERRIEGRLAGVVRMGEDTPHWEVHPAGDELLYCLSGAFDVVLEQEGGETVVPLRAGSTFCIVPRGVWHRFVIREPGDLLFITPGEGTRRRPVDG